MTCKFFSPTRFSCVTSVPILKTLLAGGIGSAGQSTTISRHEWEAAVTGGVQSHSRISGRLGERLGIVLAAPMAFQNVWLPLPGKAVQKSEGRFGRPGLASAYRIFTVTLLAVWIPRLWTWTYTRLTTPRWVSVC